MDLYEFKTGFYGCSDAQQKFKSWKLLEHLKNYVDGPWLCFGDFNVILNTSEKQSTRQPQTAQLEDLGYKGYSYTWTNKRAGDTNMKMRLDRAVAMKGWIEKFQVSTILHLLPHALDHIPIAI